MDKNEQTILAGIFNTKTITSAGGIVLALLMSYYLYKITSNHLDHIDKAIERQTSVTEQTNEVLRNLNGSIQSNTEIIRVLERKIK